MGIPDPTLVPLCGREGELRRIEAAFEETLRGEPHLVWLSGETGAGKSRCLSEIGRRLKERGFLTLQARALRGTSVHAILTDLLRPFLLLPGHADRLRIELPREFQDGVAELLRRPGPAEPPRSRRRSPYRPCRSGHLRRGEALLGILAWLADRRPVAAMLDDLHEVPDEICGLLRHLLVRAGRAPLLVVAALRSDEITPAKADFASELEAEHLLLRVELPALGPEAIEELAAALLDPTLGHEIGGWLMGASRGNPLFAVEILRLLTETGTIVRSRPAEGGGWRRHGELPDTVVPPLLATLIAERFARLSREARRLAAALAVVGTRAPISWVKRIGGLSAETFRRALAELARRHWVAGDNLGSASGPIGLAHPLAQRVIYDALPIPERAALHARCARQSPPPGARREQSEAWFAQHAARGDDPALRRRALRPAMGAAASAAARGEVTRAALLYQTAIDLLSEVPGKSRTELMIQALLGRADALHECGHLEEARNDLTRAASLARDAGPSLSPLLETRVLRNLGDVQAALGDFVSGTALLEQAYRRAAPRSARGARADATDSALLEEAARAAIRLVFVQFQRGHFDAALAWGRRARPWVERLRREDLRGFLLNNMGLVYWSTGRLADAARAFTRNREIAERLGTRLSNRSGGKPRRLEEGRAGAETTTAGSSPEVAHACSNLGLIYWNLGRIDEAERCYRQAIALHRAGGRLLSEAGSLQNYALLLEERGDFEGAARLNHQVLDTVRRLGDRRTAMQIWGNLGGNYLELGRHDEARAYLDRARRDAEELDVPSAVPDILVSRARIELATSNPSAARDLAVEAVQGARRLGLPFELGQSLRVLALAEAALDSERPALRHVRESVTVARRIGAELEVAKSMLEEGLMLIRAGAMTAGRRRVERAIAAFESRGLVARAAAARARAPFLFPEETLAPSGAKPTDTPASVRTAPREAVVSRDLQAPAAWRIKCFGPLRVFRPGESEPVSARQWGSHKARQILAYLLTVDPTGRGVMREKILSAIWPEAPADTLGHTFHVTISHLRRALSGGDPEMAFPLTQEGGFYRLVWPADIHVDTRAFASALARAADFDAVGQAYLAEAEHRRAADLVQGDYLDDIHFTWAEPLRVKYRQEYFQALRRLAHGALARWDFPVARDFAHRLLTMEPLDEASHRVVITSLLGEDRRAEALAQYSYLTKLFKRELGIKPSPETTAILGPGVR